MLQKFWNVRDDFREGDEDSNFSIFRVRWFTECPPDLFTELPSMKKSLPNPSFTELPPLFSQTKTNFFSLKSAPSHPLPKHLLWKCLRPCFRVPSLQCRFESVGLHVYLQSVLASFWIDHRFIFCPLPEEMHPVCTRHSLSVLRGLAKGQGCNFLLAIGTFLLCLRACLLTIGALLLQVGAFLLTIEAFWSQSKSASRDLHGL